MGFAAPEMRRVESGLWVKHLRHRLSDFEPAAEVWNRPRPPSRSSQAVRPPERNSRKPATPVPGPRQCHPDVPEVYKRIHYPNPELGIAPRDIPDANPEFGIGPRDVQDANPEF